jgi:Protein of unknown function (DUF1236)
MARAAVHERPQEDAMRQPLATALLAGACAMSIGLAAGLDARASDNNVTLSNDGSVVSVDAERKPPLELSEEQRRDIVEAVVRLDTHQPTPKEFKPEIGAAVPRTVDLHAPPSAILDEIPALKQYMYAHLDRQIAIVDSLASKVVALIPLPAALTYTGRSGGGTASGARDAMREREETGKPSAYSGPTTTGPNTD